MTRRQRRFRFCLYVALESPNSALAIDNLNAICKKYLGGNYDIQVVDVFKEPERALAASIFMTPTLIKLAPQPERIIVGTLSVTSTVLLALGLEAADFS
jgi:circadian clock protein KaiB